MTENGNKNLLMPLPIKSRVSQLTDWGLFLFIGKKNSTVSDYLRKIHLEGISLNFKSRLYISIGRAHWSKPLKKVQTQEILKKQELQKKQDLELELEIKKNIAHKKKIIEIDKEKAEIHTLTTKLNQEIDNDVPDLALIHNLYLNLQKVNPLTYELNNRIIDVNISNIYLESDGNDFHVVKVLENKIINFKKNIKIQNSSTNQEEIREQDDGKLFAKTFTVENIMKSQTLRNYLEPRVHAELAYDYYINHTIKPMDVLMKAPTTIFAHKKEEWELRGSKIEELNIFANTKFIRYTSYHYFAIILPFEKINSLPIRYNKNSQIIPNDEIEKSYLIENSHLNIKETKENITIYRHIKVTDPYENPHLTIQNQINHTTYTNTIIAHYYCQKAVDTYSTNPNKSKITIWIPFSYNPDVIRIRDFNLLQLDVMYNECINFFYNLGTGLDMLNFPDKKITIFCVPPRFLWSYIKENEFNPNKMQIISSRSAEDISELLKEKNYKESFNTLQTRLLGNNPTNKDLLRYKKIANDVITQDQNQILSQYSYPKLEEIAFMQARKMAAKMLVCGYGSGTAVKDKIRKHENFTAKHHGQKKYFTYHKLPLETEAEYSNRISQNPDFPKWRLKLPLETEAEYLNRISQNPDFTKCKWRLKTYGDSQIFEVQTGEVYTKYTDPRLEYLVNFADSLQSVCDKLNG